MPATLDREVRPASDERMAELMADAAAFFEAYLWEAETCKAARGVFTERGIKDKTVRAFGVGYAPHGPDAMMGHLRELGYSAAEMVATGLVTRSVRGRAHAQFRSRLMFPVRDAEGRTLGFAALGTHLGPSWALWVASPDVGLYRRSQAVFGLDRAAKQIAASGTASVQPNCLDVLKAHQDGAKNAVAVQSSRVTREQMDVLAADVSGGIDALELELPPGMRAETQSEADAAKAGPMPSRGPGPADAAPPPRFFNLKRLALVTGTAIAAMSTWTAAPLFAVWVGSHAQGGQVVSMRGAVTVLVVVAILEFTLAWALTWLGAAYDRLTGRPLLAAQTSPWHRAKRGDRVQDIRSRYGISATERVVFISVALGALAFQVWFLFYAGAPF